MNTEPIKLIVLKKYENNLDDLKLLSNMLNSIVFFQFIYFNLLINNIRHYNI